MKIIAITTPQIIEEDAFLIKNLFKRGIDIIHLRKPDADINECRKLLAQLTQEERTKIIIHDFSELYAEFSDNPYEKIAKKHKEDIEADEAYMRLYNQLNRN